MAIVEKNIDGKRPPLYTLNKNNKLVYEAYNYKEYKIKPNESLDNVLKYLISYIKSI